ncbi:hypothetical protein V8F20_006834 [Naviculisporaceae sp. PSN 640]
MTLSIFDRGALLGGLKDTECDRPASISTILPISEMGVRLEHVRTFEAFYDRYFHGRFNESMIATLLTMDIRDLERRVGDIRNFGSDQTGTKSWAVILLFLQMAFDTSTTGTFLTPLGSANAEQLLHESQWTIDRRKQMDSHACIINGTSGFDVAHILLLPSRADVTLDGSTRLHKLLRALVKHVPDFSDGVWAEKRKRLASLLFESRDRSWNMICLEKQLNHWWGRAYFGLRCLGLVDPLTDEEQEDAETAPVGSNDMDDTIVTLKLEFHWMPKRLTAAQTGPLATEDRTVDAYLAQFEGTWGNPTDPAPRVAFYRSDGQQLRTGDVFYIKVSRQHWRKMKDVLDIRWALTKIVAITGGVEALEKEWETPVEGYGEFLDHFSRWW